MRLNLRSVGVVNTVLLQVDRRVRMVVMMLLA